MRQRDREPSHSTDALAWALHVPSVVPRRVTRGWLSPGGDGAGLTGASFPKQQRNKQHRAAERRSRTRFPPDHWGRLPAELRYRFPSLRLCVTRDKPLTIPISPPVPLPSEINLHLCLFSCECPGSLLSRCPQPSRTMLFAHKKALLAPKHQAKNYIKQSPCHVGQRADKEPLLPFGVLAVPVGPERGKRYCYQCCVKTKWPSLSLFKGHPRNSIFSITIFQITLKKNRMHIYFFTWKTDREPDCSWEKVLPLISKGTSSPGAAVGCWQLR